MRVSPMNPAELDNLEGAATPIRVDRLLGRPLTPEEEESRGYADDLVRQAAAIMQGNPNMTREEAMTLASRAGVDARAAERSARRDAERQAAMPRGDSFDESYGNPVVINPTGMTVPGARDPFTGEAAPPSVLATQRDVDAYEFRTPRAEATQDQMLREAELSDDETPYRAGGPMLPSREDRDMWERGLVRVVNPRTGEPAYRLASTGSPIDLPGAAGRRGYRADLEGKYEPQFMEGPTGRVKVLVPTQAFRQQNEQREADQRLDRLADRAGMSYDDAQAMLAEGRSLDDIRRIGTDRLREDKRGRQAEVVRRAQRQYNPMALLSPEWQEFVLADRLLRDSRTAGASPNDIAQAAEQAKAAMEARLGVGAGFQPGSVQEQIAQQQLYQAKPLAVRAQEQAAAGRLNHTDVLQYADDLVHDNYSSRPGALGVSSRFTDTELGEAAARLAADLNIPEEEARKILTRVQQDRNRSPVASSPVAAIYDGEWSW
jgi:hypothetical protein